MHVHPSISGLAADPAIQKRAQAAMFEASEKWRSRDDVAPVLQAFSAYGRGLPLEECPALSKLFSDENMARTFAEGLVGAFCEPIHEQPFGQPPFRHAFDGSASNLLLARSGRALLSLTGREPGTCDPATVNFSDSTRHEIVLAGEGVARLTDRNDAGELESLTLPLRAGTRLTIDCGYRSMAVTSVARRLVTLRLSRTQPEPESSAEYDLKSGRLLGRMAGDIGQSRRDLMLALLGRMKRADAAPLLAELAREPGPDVSRWEALRECLAVDTATGFAALVAIARDAGDPLAGPAGALRAQLVETHPQLAEWEASQCPA